MDQCKEMCVECGATYLAGPYSHYCPDCRRKKTAEGGRIAAQNNALRRFVREYQYQNKAK